MCTAIWMIVGLFGWQIVLRKAGLSKDFREVCTLLPASSALLIAGLVTAWAQGWPILGFLQGEKANWMLVSLLLFLSIMPIIFLVLVPRGKVFEKAFQDAVSKDHGPMVRAATTDEELKTMFAYLHSLPVVASPTK